MVIQSTIIPASERLALLAGIQGTGRARTAPTANASLLYARVSTSVQDSIPEQLEAEMRYSLRLGVPAGRELQDVGSGLDSDRPGYQEMLRLARSGEYSHVIAYKADRLSRDDVEFVSVVRELLRLGVEVHDTSIGPITSNTVGVLGMVAYLEVRNNSDRTTMKLAGKAAEGKKLGRPMVGYRHTATKGIYEPDPDTAPIVVEAFRMAAQGVAIDGVRDYLNASLGRKMHRDATLRLLRNEFYAGLNVNCKERASKLDGRYARPREEWQVTRHDAPLVSQEVWDLVQARIAQGRNVGQTRSRPGAFALTGLVWCARCNRRMRAKRSSNGYTSFECLVCGKGRSEKRLERVVRDGLRRCPIGSDAIAGEVLTDVEARRGALHREIAAVSRQLEKLTQRRGAYYQMRADAEIAADECRSLIRATDEERDGLLARQAEIEAELGRLPSAAYLAEGIVQRMAGLDSWTQLLDGRSVEDRRSVYRECVKAVRFDPTTGDTAVEWTEPIALLMTVAIQNDQSHTVPTV